MIKVKFFLGYVQKKISNEIGYGTDFGWGTKLGAHGRVWIRDLDRFGLVSFG